jgi:hypothetical protein
MAQLQNINVRVSAATLKAIDAEAASEFTNRSAIAAARLEAAYVSGAAASPLPLSPEAVIRHRKLQIENERLEIKLAREAGEVIPTEKVLNIFSADYAVIRSRLLNIPQAIPGLSPEQVFDANKIIQDVMTDLSGEQSTTWDDIAKEGKDA